MFGTTSVIHNEKRPKPHKLPENNNNPIVLTVNTMRGETSFQLEEEPTINIDGKNGVIVIDTINDSYLFSINNIECMRYTDDCNVYYQ